MGVHIEGIIAIVLILLPNIIFTFLPPTDVPTNLRTTPITLTVLEQAGRIACLTLPIMFGIKIAEQHMNFIVILMGVCIVLYYICWIHFFINGRVYDQLFKPLVFIPVPMAVFPALYFVLMGVWLESLIFLIPAVLFSIGHIVASWSQYRQMISN
ncbi:hypothetical protein [Paenibacillus macquariensis]|uniref:Spore germination protein n=1 Tax=Paenibacillus macquariensis TaxID=948756 RepID=A0ABY1JU78_9BACL|nr:hypothetical protein [Paenibacillus macquariensis]MEC0090999.1 hypothetical protein [Paenibacillus macquariensis]OAB34718.1 hypothetical protein PMSM_12780 [Paenibacillus macquariensis subsp. macquariensis]SIQ78968.1 hypothetical protein SAMN05421578_10460 [Paenibacillus macquariensis]